MSSLTDVFQNLIERIRNLEGRERASKNEYVISTGTGNVGIPAVPGAGPFIVSEVTLNTNGIWLVTAAFTNLATVAGRSEGSGVLVVNGVADTVVSKFAIFTGEADYVTTFQQWLVTVTTPVPIRLREDWVAGNAFTCVGTNSRLIAILLYGV